MTVPAGEAVWLSAAELESGDGSVSGALGDGEDKWRLTVSSDAPLTVISLIEDRNGALGNLSTPGRRYSNMQGPQYLIGAYCILPRTPVAEIGTTITKPTSGSKSSTLYAI